MEYVDPTDVMSLNERAAAWAAAIGFVSDEIRRVISIEPEDG